MRISGLEEIDLDIDAADIAALFDPFVDRRAAQGDAEWNQEVQARRRKILRKYLRRMALGWMPRHQRLEESIIDKYSEVWSAMDHESYSLDVPPSKFSLWEWRGQRYFASTIGATRVRQMLLVKVMDHLRPARVLEVGCGNGINLLLAAGRCPDTEFTGVDLTAAGNRVARRFQDRDTLPPGMRDYCPLPLRDTTAFKAIRFERANAADLPFDDGAFDLVVTVLSLEQMERIRHQALSEIARVCGGHSFMIEPFRDVNDRGWPRLNAVQRNYFRGRIDDLARYRLAPLWAIEDYPQETFLKTCAVLAKKN